MTITSTITNVTEQLQQEETKLKEQLEQRQTQVTALQADLTRLQTALAALTGNNNKQQRKQKRPNTKPAATQTEVSHGIADALADGRVLTAEQITQSVEKVTVAAGKSRVGLALRIEQALNDNNIEQQKNGSYKLALN